MRGNGLALLAVLVFCTGCAGTDIGRYATADVAALPAAAVATISFQGIPLRSGDIIVSEGYSESSLLLTLMAERYSPYVHAGIIVVDGGEPYVHHAFASFWPVPGRAPTTTMSGRIRRDPLASYLSQREVVSIGRLPDATAADRVAAFARDAHRERLAFDPFFDTAAADAVYCTEFVARALLDAGVGAPAPVRRNANRSLAKAFDWLQIESREFWLAGDLLDGLTPVATLSRTLSPTQIDARFALKAELHRRFTPEQPLGNIFRWGLGGPQLRPHIARLVTAAMATSETRYTDERLRALIQTMLGDAPKAATRLAERGSGATMTSPR